MSLYEITRRCGHVEEVQIRGTNIHGERETEARRLARMDCRDCYRTRKQSQREKTTDEWVDVASLPQLRGTERQVAWAEKIRIDGIATIVADITNPPTGGNKLIRALQTGHAGVALGPAFDQLADEERAAVARMLVDAAAAQTSASWWINNRDHITGSVLDSLSEDVHTVIARLLGHR